MKSYFKKYNSIENSYQEAYIESILEQGFGDVECFVQEKVHGANFSFITDGKNVTCAKRISIIEEDEYFFNYEFVLERYRESVLKLYDYLAELSDCKTISIFGELFGGAYPHKEVPKDENAKLVQRGVYYCPQNDFYAFDILIDNEFYMNADVIIDLFEKFGFFYAKTLFKAGFKDCLAYPNAFKTTIPKELGLPEIEGNICEGVIIRPIVPRYLKNGSRIIIKNKNEKWAENNKYIDVNFLRSLLQENEELSDEAQSLCEEIYKLITKNRLDNLISKIGEVNPSKDFGKLTGLYNKDVLTDFMKNFELQYKDLENHEAKAVNKFLNKESTKLIKEYFNI